MVIIILPVISKIISTTISIIEKKNHKDLSHVMKLQDWQTGLGNITIFLLPIIVNTLITLYRPL